MKKVVIALSIAIIAVSIALLVFISKSNIWNKSKNEPTVNTEHPRFPVNGVTLNGLNATDADDRISNFIDDNTSSDTKTAIWLSKDWVFNICDLLTNEQSTLGTDGFRIYFAKKPGPLSGKLKNTIVIVSTKNDGADPKAESKADHLDYFDHNLAYLGTTDAQGTEEWGGSDPGAKLYNPAFKCPADACNITTIANYISCEDAAAAVANFGKVSNIAINTNSEWFPVKLIQYLKTELIAARNNNPTVPADGIRIYFAKNVNNAADPKHRNRHTFIFVTTLAIKNSQGVTTSHEDYYNCYSSKKYTHKKGTNDHGEECPNNCNGVTLP